MGRGIQIGRRNQLNTYFPRELVREVLARLPVKSLLRFMRACKEWFTLIENPQFAKFQLQLSVHARGSGIIYQRAKSGKFFYVDLNVERGVVSNFDFKVEKIVGDAVLLKASCNGLLLLERTISDGRREYYVCNPLTKWYSKLPQFLDGYCNSPASLCYDSLNQKFKVLLVFKDQISYKCAVFTLGNKNGGGGDGNITSRSWRILDIPVTSGEITPAMYPRTPAVHTINGAIYWMIQRTPWTRPCILRMDLSSEEFSLIDNPVLQSEHKISWGYSLHKMKGSLCLAVAVSFAKLDLWVLNDAVKQAWSKEFSINFRSIVEKFDLHEFFFCKKFFITERPRPVIIFFGSAKKHLLLYNLFTGQFRVVNKNFGMRQSLLMLAHVDSFISF